MKMFKKQRFDFFRARCVLQKVFIWQVFSKGSTRLRKFSFEQIQKNKRKKSTLATLMRSRISFKHSAIRFYAVEML